MTNAEAVRGHVYRMHDDEYGLLYCMVISTLPSFDGDTSCLAVRVTVTTASHSFPGWVRLESGDPGCGYVVTHDLDRVDHDELKEDLGPLSAMTLVKVEQALKRMLGL